MTSTVRYQRFEGLAIFVAAGVFYFWLEYDWWWFFIFLLAFDVFIAGYLFGKKLGAQVYNIGHNLILPSVAITAGALANNHFFIGLGLIWLAHIGIDRALGYGFKELAGFKHTHLGRIGKK